MPISPDDVDDRTVPVPAPHVGIVTVDDGGVLVDEEAGRGFALNATAALVWRLFDAVSPFGDVIDDVSAAFGAPRPGVADSVHGMVRTFGEFGLFENVTRNIASVPIDVEYVDLDECGEPIPPRTTDGAAYDTRYLVAPPNA